jgi:eukaryotic-like serine/threonine-protein kinase
LAPKGGEPAGYGERTVAETQTPDSRTGRVLAGRYRLDHLIASGGMAQVWEATDEVLARRVAVKVLHPHLAADEKFVARFRREAVAVARLAHPSIVSIYDTCSDDGIEAIVMELVRGTTLRRELDRRDDRIVEPGEAVGIISQVADALDVAHRAGVVHRDIKPANILLSEDGRVMVADFGIAKAAEEVDLTQAGTTLGTAKYLAPEQVEGQPVDARADVYALGVVLYELLCGRAPFVADTEAATALARLQREPLRPRQLRAGVPREIEEVVLRAMARRPEDRYSTGGDLRDALQAAARGDSVEPRTPPPPPPAPLPTGVTPGVRNDGAPAWPRPAAATITPPPAPRFSQTERSWLVPTVVIVIIAVGLGVAGVLVSRTEAARELLDRLDDGGALLDEAEPAPAVLAGAQAFDPQGDGTESDGEASLAVDGDASTFWETEGYNTRRLSGLKEGVGLVVSLAEATELDQLRITSPSNDWSARIFVAEEAGDSLGDWGEPIATQEAIPAGDVVFDLGGTRAAHVLIWITDLGDEPPRVHTRVAEVQVTT